MNNYEFPKIDFESELYHGELCTREDLRKLFRLYDGTLTKAEILQAKNRVIQGLGADETTFGFKSDDVGEVTLKDFLEKNNIII